MMRSLAARLGSLLLVGALACGDGGSPDDPTGPSDPVGEEPLTLADTIAPAVVATVPAHGDSAVSPLTTFEVTFSEPVLVGSMGTGFLVLEAAGHAAPGLANQTSATTVEFSPSFPLDFGVRHRARVRTGVIDTAGNELTSEYEWEFTTDGTPISDIPASSFLDHIEVLAHDSMRGRFAGSAEELAAAAYVRGEFQEIGLEPGAPGYFQEFVIPPGHGGEGLASRNVLGVLPGSGDLASEWLVVGAHYDHIGTTLLGPGNEVAYNGADDNASGTAMMMEVARAVGELAGRDGLAGLARRTVLFHAYGAEEVGLVGSYHYCGNPTVPLVRISAMINLDMVGRLRDGTLEVIGPLPGELLGRLATSLSGPDLRLSFFPDLLGRSDQRCFFEAGRPVLFLHTGLHPQYHTFFDDVELINGQGMTRVARLATEALVKLMARR